jgi:hypothetical protein
LVELEVGRGQVVERPARDHRHEVVEVDPLDLVKPAALDL